MLIYILLTEALRDERAKERQREREVEGFVGRLGWLAAQDGVGVGQRHACCGCFGALFCSRFELWPGQGGMTILILHSSSGHVPSHPALLADKHLVDNSGDYYVFANKANACIFSCTYSWYSCVFYMYYMGDYFN